MAGSERAGPNDPRGALEVLALVGMEKTERVAVPGSVLAQMSPVGHPLSVSRVGGTDRTETPDLS
jgi:hypothetical protein